MRHTRAPALAVAVLAAGAALASPVRAEPTKAQARIAAAAAAYDAVHARLAVGAATVDAVYLWSVRWLDAQREQPAQGKALVAAARLHLDRMIALEAEVTKAVAAGALASDAAAAVAYYRAEAELWVERKGKR